MLIIVLLLISFGFVVGWSQGNDYEILKEFQKSEGKPYRNSKGEIVNSVW